MPAPIYDWNRGWRLWSLPEIYVGPGGQPGQVYVPNVNDAVHDWVQGTFRVTDVDQTTKLSTMIKASFDQLVGGVAEEDVLLGSSLGETREQYRMYVKGGALPFSACLDGALKIYQASAHHIKVFLGTDTSMTGNVISAMVNSSGIQTSENVPLALIAGINGVNYALQTPSDFSVTEALQDGDVVTAVVYTADDKPIGAYKHIVINTDFIRTTDASKKYIVGIDLISPFMSATNLSLLEYPINLPIQSGSLVGRVRYSDGTSINLPIDGTKFELQGITAYVATVVGQTANLVLTYHMASNEYAYGAGAVPGDRFINKSYQIRTVEAQSAYTVKLFAVPRWRTTPAQWELDWYLYTLDRDIIYNVTPYVQYSGTAFDGTNLTSRQALTATINLNQIGAGYLYFQHVQTFFIRLLATGNTANAASYWRLEYTNSNVYGDGLCAQKGNSVTPGQFTLTLDNGFANYGEWKAEIFDKIEPLYAPGVEVIPPPPTHFRIKYGTTTNRTVPITQWNLLHDNFTEPLTQGMPIRLEFYRDVTGTVLELGVASLTLKA